MLRYKRLVSCLLSFSLLVCCAGSFLAVKASAAVSNLVPPLLVNWTLQNYKGGDVTVSTVDAGVSSLMIGNTGYGFVYKQLNLIQGHKYRFTVRMIQSSFTWSDLGSDWEGFCTIGFCDNISENKVWLAYAQFVAGENNTIKSCEFIAGSSPVYALVELVTNGHYCSSRLTDISIIDLGSSDTQSVIDNANQNAQDIQDNANSNTDRIGGWFSDLWENIKGIFYVDSSSSFHWQVGKQIDGTGKVVSSNNQRACVSDFFYIEDYNAVYYMDFPSTWFFYAMKYSDDSDSSYISRQYYSNPNSHTFTFEQGYYYRFMVYTNNNLDLSSISDVDNYFNERFYFTVSKSVFDVFFEKIINGLKSLFIPSDGFFDDFTEDMNVVLEERFGVLFQIGDFLDDVLTSLKDLIQSSGSSDFTFTLPAMSFSFLGYNISLWDDITIEFTEIFTNMSWFSILYVAYSVTVQIILVGILFSYGDKLFKEVFRS